MSELVEIDAKDQRQNNYVIREYDTGLELEPYFRDACSECRHVNLFAAIREFGIPETQRVRVRRGTDFYSSSDGFTGVSARMKDLLEENAVGGLNYYAMPNDPYFLIEPTHSLEIDFLKSHFNPDPPCPVCQHRHVYGLLKRSDLPAELPTREFVSVRDFGRRPDHRFYADKDVISLLKKAGLKGITYCKVSE
ncbi:hypothetical protein ACFL2H_10190 [Planctomycetota bacterium]